MVFGVPVVGVVVVVVVVVVTAVLKATGRDKDRGLDFEDEVILFGFLVFPFFFFLAL